MPVFNPRHRIDTPAGQAAIALYRISQAIGNMLRTRGGERRLSPAQVQALLFLRYARPGIRTIGGLAQRLMTTDATASGVVDALENKRLVERQPRATDRRVMALRLTGAGEQETATLDDVLDDVESAIAELPPSEQQALIHATQAIVRRLQAAGHVQVYEMCWNCQFFRRNAHSDTPDRPHHCAFVDAPLPEPDTQLECPDFVPADH